jgi:enoyl-CoA hydratase/carnithine racemase
VSTSEPTGADAILTERHGDDILVIRMHRPHLRNAFDGATAHALEAVIDTYEEDDRLRCAILTGSDIVFSAGQDLIAAARGDMGAHSAAAASGSWRNRQQSRSSPPWKDTRSLAVSSCVLPAT